MGELRPLPSTYDLVSHHRAQEGRHRHAAVGDGDIIAGSLGPLSETTSV
jgi:hypothetical protein